jgi:hypothetical protein
MLISEHSMQKKRHLIYSPGSLLAWYHWRNHAPRLAMGVQSIKADLLHGEYDQPHFPMPNAARNFVHV